MRLPNGSPEAEVVACIVVAWFAIVVSIAIVATCARLWTGSW